MSRKADDEADVKPQFIRYKPHPMLALFPPPTEADLSMMEEDVKEHGVTNEIVLWEHPNTNVFLIDGRTREEAAFRAFMKKVDAGEAPNATNGIALQPGVFWFKGDLNDVYRFISKTHIRKNYSQAQKAVMVVRQHYYEYKAVHGNRLPSLEDEMAKPGAVSAEELARRGGVNIHYVRVVRRLYRDRPDLLDSVAIGAVQVNEADRMSKHKVAEEELPADAPAPAKDPEVVRDGQRNEVPKNLEDAFRACSSYRVIAAHLDDAITAAGKLAGTEGAVWFDVELFTGLVQGAVKMAKESAPHIMCVDCEGKGRPRYARADCTRCKGSGYVSKGFLKSEKKAKGGTAETEE